jgi:hypothetical protein
VTGRVVQGTFLRPESMRSVPPANFALGKILWRVHSNR